MNHSHLYLASKDHIFIFALKDMQLERRLKTPNHLLRISLGPTGLAYSDVLDHGKIIVANIAQQETWKDIVVSKHFPVQKIKFNQKGDLLATQCAHENLIKIYSKNTEMYCTLQITGCYELVDMAFCPNLRFLICLLREKDIDYLQLFDLNSGKDT